MENNIIFTFNNKPVIIAEDGSVDVDKLEKDGFYVIIYRNGAKKPEFAYGQTLSIEDVKKFIEAVITEGESDG